MILKLSGLRCSLQTPDGAPAFLIICRAEAAKTRQVVWCEPAAAGSRPDGSSVCCSPVSSDTSCRFTWSLGPIAPAHELFEAAVVIIDTLASLEGQPHRS
ncbi:hypothetical protein [Actinomadura rupiterrae]|uniref:hypothetical protein n=1 Tax=Actinomadura rupiterrae TaxID=559627 RepID=UPI0020A4D8C1|nr:hypothetical protein [Actinomadura rupiterrae]MCP2335160.1 hypothetical protein [Actinomadura rupiterrae]